MTLPRVTDEYDELTGWLPTTQGQWSLTEGMACSRLLELNERCRRSAFAICIVFWTNLVKVISSS
jgi:hypothetical protein